MTSPAAKTLLTAQILWQIERIGAIALAPDGERAVCTVMQPDAEKNQSLNHLWLLSTMGGVPRQLTRCGAKDGQPAWSPKGERIGIIAKREQAAKRMMRRSCT